MRGHRVVQISLAVCLVGCGGASPDMADGDGGGSALGARPPGWTEGTHGRMSVDYAAAFPQGQVPRLDIRIAPADWAAMQADLEDILGRFGGGGLSLPQPGTLNLVPRDPKYFEATVEFAGKTWNHVGIRARGNSTLARTWREGVPKLPFRLDFDEFEDAHPEVRDQRFFGLKALALLNNRDDDSLLREKVAGDLYRAAGVPAPRCGFARVFVDRGMGPTYFGLYTAVEVPEKTMMQAVFGNGDGNLYKPDGEAAKFVAFDQAHFEKKTNESSTFDDVLAVFKALHAPRLDQDTWRTNLERVWDGEGFMRWLAVNTAIQNWDTYGVLPHNYYLYGVRSENGRLHWIAWDHNNAFRPGIFPFWLARSLTLSEVGNDWPLIRYQMDNPTYRATYFRQLRAFAQGPFAAAAVVARLRAEHTLISRYVVGPEGERAPYTFLEKPDDFSQAVDDLVAFVNRRAAEVARVASMN